MPTFEGSQALEELARSGVLVGAEIRSLSVSEASVFDVAVRMDCVPRADGPVARLRLVFLGMSHFDWLWREGRAFGDIAAYRAVPRADGSVYVSFEPEGPVEAPPDEADGCVIEARQLEVEFVMKSGEGAASAGREPAAAGLLFEGERALDEIDDQLGLLDGALRSLFVRRTPDGGATVQLQCVPRSDSPAKVHTLRFSEVTRWDWVSDSHDCFSYIEDYISLVREDGSLYLALDPYDYTVNAPHPRDNAVIEARRLEAWFVMKSPEEAAAALEDRD